LYLWLSTDFDVTSKSGIALVFAKEKALAPLWQRAKHLNSIFVDIEASRGTDLLADMRNLPFEADSIDLIWCHHVLEHIEDDRAAIREVCRVLRPGTGAAILSVPMKPSGQTEEYGFPDPNISGHWRIYGEDFIERLEEGGLTVQRIDFGLSSEDSRRYAISEEPVYLCTRRRFAGVQD
jgi:SAM-dependent methyltransferase